MNLKESLFIIFSSFAQEGKVLSPDSIKSLFGNDKIMDRFHLAFISKLYDVNKNNDLMEKLGDKKWNDLMLQFFFDVAKEKIENTGALAYIGDYIQSNMEMVKYMESLGLKDHVKKLSVYDDKVYADAFEAMIAAIYYGIVDMTGSIGKAYEGTYQFVEYIFKGLDGGKYMPDFSDPLTYKSKKTILKEWFQDHLGEKMEPKTTINQMPTGGFMAMTIIEKKGRKITYEGKGTSKAQAENESRKKAIDAEVDFKVLRQVIEAKKEGVHRKDLLIIGLLSPVFKVEQDKMGNYINTIYNGDVKWSPPSHISNPIIAPYSIDNVKDLLIYLSGNNKKKI